MVRFPNNLPIVVRERALILRSDGEGVVFGIEPPGSLHSESPGPKIGVITPWFEVRSPRLKLDSRPGAGLQETSRTMAYCPECNLEYVDSVAVCPDCDRELVSALPGETAAEEARKWGEVLPEDLVELCQVEGEAEAQVIRTFLESGGIPSILHGEAVRYIYGFSRTQLARVKILVRASDAKRARELLDSAEPLPPED